MHTSTLRTLLRRSDAAANYGILVAGVIHTGLTPVFKPQAGEDQLWFAGTGLALGFLGVINAMRRTPAAPTTVLWWCRSANVAAFIYMVLLARMLPAPHVYTIAGCVGVVTARSFTTED